MKMCVIKRLSIVCLCFSAVISVACGNSESSDRSTGDADSDTDTDSDTGTDNDSDSDLEDDAGAGTDTPACEPEPSSEPNRVNVLILLDRSASMSAYEFADGKTYEESLDDAIAQVVTDPADAHVNFGLSVFPALTCMKEFVTAPSEMCYPAAEALVPIGTDTGNAIDEQLSALDTCGGTPTAASLAGALSEINNLSQEFKNNSSSILLITDSAPNCAADLDPDTCVSSDPALTPMFSESCLDDLDTILAVEALYDAGITTYVVGIGNSFVSDVMTSIAAAGSGNTRDYMTASDSDSLLQAIYDAVLELSSKTFCTPCALGCVDSSNVGHCLPDGSGYKTIESCADDQQCEDGACVDCIPENLRSCLGNDVYWYDSCGRPDTRIATCDTKEECSDGECVEPETRCNPSSAPIDEPADECAPAENEDEVSTDDSGNTDTIEVASSAIGIAALQQRYLEVVGRPTHSLDVSYLRWKIGQAQRGKVPVGPIQNRREPGLGRDFKVLPIRMESDLVDKLDEAWKRQGLKNRMDLFRRSLQSYLTGVGENEVSEMLR